MPIFQKDYKLHKKTKAEFLKSNLVKLARSTCPVDTGNMKYSAIYCEDMPNGFRIVWDLVRAPYMIYVDKGAGNLTPKKQQNIGFVQKGMSLCLAYLVYFDINGGKVPKKLEFKYKKNGGRYLFTDFGGTGFGYINKNDYLVEDTKNNPPLTYRNKTEERIMKEVGYSKDEYLRSVFNNAIIRTNASRNLSPTLSKEEQQIFKNNQAFFLSSPEIKRLLKKGAYELNRQGIFNAEDLKRADQDD